MTTLRLTTRLRGPLDADSSSTTFWYICTSISESSPSLYRRWFTSVSGASKLAHRDMNVLALYVGCATSSPPGPRATSARKSRCAKASEWNSPTCSGGGSIHSSGSISFSFAGGGLAFLSSDVPGMSIVGAKSSRGVGLVSMGTTLDVTVEVTPSLNFSAASSSMTLASPTFMGSSSPSTVSWLYLRRMSLRLTPLRTSSWRSSRALAYSAACHSGGVSSGMPASSQRTYARMPMSSSGTTIWETSAIRSPSAVWPPCARVTVAMERLAATGRTEARSAEAPRAVLDPAA
mmetsp:Transcript_9953/g.45481  ORF Transcript_9953/g.45481 Transcript_9953/m.45481 type:complete len:290 (+) Transcript_9953:837-1706(+)